MMNVAALAELIGAPQWLSALARLGRQALIGAGVLGVAAFAVQRAHRHGISPYLPKNQIALGLLTSIPIAAHLLLVWRRPSAQGATAPLWVYALVPAVFGVVLVALIVLRQRRWPLLTWLDVCAPVVLLGHAVAQVVSGFATPDATGGLLAAGLASAGAAAVTGLVPPLAALGALLWAEHNARGELRPGDSALLCGVLYALGFMLVAGLHAPFDEAPPAWVAAALDLLD